MTDNYREVRRKAVVGEKIKVTMLHPAPLGRSIFIGEILTVNLVDDAGDIWFVKERSFDGAIHYEWNGICEYVVLEPVTEPSFTPLNVKIKRLTTDARIPTYRTDGAAAFDFYASGDVIIAPGETAIIPLGIAVEIPVGYVLIVAMRSGIALKTYLRQPNGIGVIDSDYRGEVNMLFTNDTPLDEIEGDYGGPSRTYSVDGECSLRYGYLSDSTYLINKGDRVAQGFIMPLPTVTFTEVDELSETDRGAGGFGSTGVSGEADAA